MDQSIKGSSGTGMSLLLSNVSHVAGALWFLSPACQHTRQPSAPFIQEFRSFSSLRAGEEFKNQPKLKTASCLIYADTLLDALCALAPSQKSPYLFIYSFTYSASILNTFSLPGTGKGRREIALATFTYICGNGSERLSGLLSQGQSGSEQTSKAILSLKW